MYQCCILFCDNQWFYVWRKGDFEKSCTWSTHRYHFFFHGHEKEVKRESSIQSKVTTRSSKECYRSIQTKAAVRFLPTPSLTCSVHQSYVWHMNNQSWRRVVDHYAALFHRWDTWSCLGKCMLKGKKHTSLPEPWKPKQDTITLTLINSYKTVQGSGGMW